MHALVELQAGVAESVATANDRTPLQKSDIEDAGRVYGELFVAFLAPALFLLVLELLLASLLQRRWP